MHETVNGSSIDDTDDVDMRASGRIRLIDGYVAHVDCLDRAPVKQLTQHIIRVAKPPPPSPGAAKIRVLWITVSCKSGDSYFDCSSLSNAVKRRGGVDAMVKQWAAKGGTGYVRREKASGCLAVSETFSIPVCIDLLYSHIITISVMTMERFAVELTCDPSRRTIDSSNTDVTVMPCVLNLNAERRTSQW